MNKRLLAGISVAVLLTGIYFFMVSRHPGTAPARNLPDQKVSVAELQRFDLTLGKGPVAAPGMKVEAQVQILSARGKVIRNDIADKKTEWIPVAAAASEHPLSFYVEGMQAGAHRRVTVPWGPKYKNDPESGEPLIYDIFVLKVK